MRFSGALMLVRTGSIAKIEQRALRVPTLESAPARAVRASAGVPSGHPQCAIVHNSVHFFWHARIHTIWKLQYFRARWCNFRGKRSSYYFGSFPGTGPCCGLRECDWGYLFQTIPPILHVLLFMGSAQTGGVWNAIGLRTVNVIRDGTRSRKTGLQTKKEQ